MSKLYDVVATVGKYQKGSETKYLNKNVGVVIETKYGPKLKLASWFNPAGCERDEDGHIWLAMFPPKDKQAQASNDGPGFQDSDIPDFT